VGVAAGALGLIALIPAVAVAAPWLAAAAVGAGALAFVLDTTLALGGQGDWTDVAIGAAGLALFGFGRALTAASRGTAGAAAIERGVAMDDHVARVGSLKGFLASGDDGQRIFGAAARSRTVRAVADAKLLGTDRVTGLMPSWRNWRTALSFRRLDLPGRRLLQLSDHATRLARIATGVERVVSPAVDVIDLSRTTAEAMSRPEPSPSPRLPPL
jgi:hypothetical protein